jgi:hypothetical protein
LVKKVVHLGNFLVNLGKKSEKDTSLMKHALELGVVDLVKEGGGNFD